MRRAHIIKAARVEALGRFVCAYYERANHHCPRHDNRRCGACIACAPRAAYERAVQRHEEGRAAEGNADARAHVEELVAHKDAHQEDIAEEQRHVESEPRVPLGPEARQLVMRNKQVQRANANIDATQVNH